MIKVLTMLTGLLLLSACTLDFNKSFFDPDFYYEESEIIGTWEFGKAGQLIISEPTRSQRNNMEYGNNSLIVTIQRSDEGQRVSQQGVIRTMDFSGRTLFEFSESGKNNNAEYTLGMLNVLNNGNVVFYYVSSPASDNVLVSKLNSLNTEYVDTDYNGVQITPGNSTNELLDWLSNKSSVWEEVLVLTPA